MARLTTGTFERPADLGNRDDPKVLYARSYLLTRVVVGVMGVALPTLLFALDGFFLRGDGFLRGSLSAYYHSGARDLFVAGMCVTGFLLMTYMAAQRSTWDYRLSTVGGVAALGVAFLPTTRPGLGELTPRCGSDPVPSGCTQLQQAFGESAVAAVHFASAGIFILSLAAICFVFARRERLYTHDVFQERLHRVCGGVIVAAVILAVGGSLAGLEAFGITALYAGEVIAVYAFGVSWIAKGRDLLKEVVKAVVG